MSLCLADLVLYKWLNQADWIHIWNTRKLLEAWTQFPYVLQSRWVESYAAFWSRLFSTILRTHFLNSLRVACNFSQESKPKCPCLWPCCCFVLGKELTSCSYMSIREKSESKETKQTSFSLMGHVNGHVVCKGSVASYVIDSLSQQLGLFDVLSASMPSMAAEMVMLMH